MRPVFAFALAASVAVFSGESRAAIVTGGQTSVALDTAAISQAAGLTLFGISLDVINPGAIPGSVAFGINPRDAATLPTTLEYDPNSFLPPGSFSGTLEHKGSLYFFNNDNAVVQVGDFTIGFDGDRNGAASGFFVASNAGLEVVLFDVAAEGLVSSASDFHLDIAGDLLVSPELADALGNAGLAGAGVGKFQINATAVPEVSTLAACGLAAFGGLVVHRRRRRKSPAVAA